MFSYNRKSTVCPLPSAFSRSAIRLVVDSGYIIAFHWRFLLTIRDKGEEGLFFRVWVNSIAEKPAG
jgi:hypothetical protein